MHPGISLDVDVAGSDGIVRKIVEDEAEIGIIFSPPSEQRIVTLHASRQPLYAVMSPRHEFARRKTVSLRHLAGHAVAMLAATQGVRQTIDQVSQHERVTIEPRFTCNSTLALKAFPDRYGAVTILPLFAVMSELDAGRLAALPLADKGFRTTRVELIARRGRDVSLAARKLAEALHGRMASFKRT